MRTRAMMIAFLFAVVLLMTVGTSTSSAQRPNAQPFLLKATLGALVQPRAGPLAPIQGVTNPEFRKPKDIEESIARLKVAQLFNRRPNKTAENRLSAAEGKALKFSAPSNGGANFDGLGFFDQRFANGGNQFSIEPPDQGLCVGGKYVLETVNTVLQVYDKAGNPLSGVIDVNTFFGYPAQIDRTTGLIGPSVGDVSCFYDADTKRFFFLNWTLQVVPETGDLTGAQTLDIAVSKTSDPRGEWFIYHIPSQNDGQDGTPSHPDCPCLSDYPHMGMDKYGLYIATNEFPLLGPGLYGGFNGAQLYAVSKHKLAKGVASVPVVLFENVQMANGVAAYSIHPAWSVGKDYDTSNNGTEYLLSHTNTFSRFASQVALYAVTNSKSLDNNNPNVSLHTTLLDSVTYGDPGMFPQQDGNIPLADCLNIDCLGFGPPPEPQVVGPINGNDAGMKQVYYSKGKVYGATGSVISFGGTEHGGVVYHIVKPGPLTRAGLEADLLKSVLFGSSDLHLVFPAIAVAKNGKAVIGMSAFGPDLYPSAVYVTLNKQGDLSSPLLGAATGLGPQDGFTEYFIGGGRPRWGDYSAAVSVGKDVWFATEYINQSCTFAEYLADTTCGGTRAALGNWSTRVVQVSP